MADDFDPGFPPGMDMGDGGWEQGDPFDHSHSSWPQWDSPPDDIHDPRYFQAQEDDPFRDAVEAEWTPIDRDASDHDLSDDDPDRHDPDRRTSRGERLQRLADAFEDIHVEEEEHPPHDDHHAPAEGGTRPPRPPRNNDRQNLFGKVKEFVQVIRRSEGPERSAIIPSLLAMGASATATVAGAGIFVSGLRKTENAATGQKERNKKRMAIGGAITVIGAVATYITGQSLVENVNHARDVQREI